MKNPFKSRYYFRIIDKIAELENEKAEFEIERAQYAYYSRPEKCWEATSKIEKVEGKIKVLRGLL